MAPAGDSVMGRTTSIFLLCIWNIRMSTLLINKHFGDQSDRRRIQGRKGIFGKGPHINCIPGRGTSPPLPNGPRKSDPQEERTLSRKAFHIKNANAIKHIGEILSELGLDHITPAFIKCVEQKSICQKCGNQVVNPDQLCCCPDSTERCHCTGSCCDQRKIVADGWPMFNNASGVHHQQEPVFPKFGEVLTMTKCEGLTEMMEQLTVNAAAHGGLSAGENDDLLTSINKELADAGLNNMMDAFNRALDSKFMCKMCKKQLELTTFATAMMPRPSAIVTRALVAL